MRIGIAGPVATEDVSSHLSDGGKDLPRGYGGASLLGTLISTLIERGHEVSAYTLDAVSPSIRQTVIATGPSFKLYIVPFRPHSLRFNGKRLGRMLDFFKEEREALRRAMETDKPDVVHAHWSYEFALAAIETKMPHLITCHDSPLKVLRYIPTIYRLGKFFMAKEVFKKGRAFTTVSEYLKEEIQRYTRVPIDVVPNPAPNGLFKNTFVERRGCFDSERPKIAMILNGWQARKNPKPAIRAFALLRERFPVAKLYLFGNDFGPGGRAQRWAQKNKIGEGLVFCGFKQNEDLLKNLASMDLLLHPALEESFGMCLVEAMAMGIPVIGGDKSGAVPWVLDYGKAGELVDVQSETDIHHGMIRIITDKARYASLTNAARGRAQKLFSPMVVAEAYEKKYAMAMIQAATTIKEEK